MATPPPPIEKAPPEYAFNSWWVDFWQALVTVITRSPFQNFLAAVGENTAIRIEAAVISFAFKTQAGVLLNISKALQTAEDESGGVLLGLAAQGIGAFFGRPVAAAELSPKGGPGANAKLGEELGKLVIDGLFSGVGAGLRPGAGAGVIAAQRLLGFNLALGLSGYLTEGLIPPIVQELLPKTLDLKQVMVDSLGLGRITRRALQPFIQELVSLPLQQELRRTYLNAELTPPELSHLYNTKVIDAEEYFAGMATHGYSRAYAAQLNVLNSKALARAELQALFRLGVIAEADIKDGLIADGFTPEFADVLTSLTTSERVLTATEEMGRLALDMYAAWELTEDQRDALLAGLHLSPPELEAYKALASAKRSRPRHLPPADVQTAYDEDIMTLDQVHGYLQHEGYNEADTAILSAVFVQKKLKAGKAKATPTQGAKGPKPGAISRADAEALYIEGIVDQPKFVELLQGLDYEGDALNLILDEVKAKKAKADAAAVAHLRKTIGIKAKQGTIEEAYTRGLVTVDQLRVFYQEQGFTPDAIDLLIQLRELELADHNAKKSKAGSGGTAKPTK